MQLVWQISSYLVASVIGGLVASFAHGRRVGRWQAQVEAEIQAAAKSRAGIHRDIERIEKRLAGGDTRFEQQMVKLAEQATRLEAVAADLEGFQSALTQFVTRVQCETEHRGVEHRLTALERQS